MLLLLLFVFVDIFYGSSPCMNLSFLQQKNIYRNRKSDNELSNEFWEMKDNKRRVNMKHFR